MTKTDDTKADSTGVADTAKPVAVATPKLTKAVKTKPKPKTHKMLEGEEFWRVATENGVSVRELAERNKLWNLSVAAGVVIQLP